MTESTEVAILDRLEDVAVPGVEVTFTGLRVTEDLSFEAFAEAFRAARRFKTATSWWIGDLVNYGEAAYGERYAQAVDLTGYSNGHLRNCAWVCRQIAMSRRNDKLGFSVHYAVAALEPDEQTEWLDAALANDWDAARLRQELRAARRAPAPPERPQWSENEPPSTRPLTPEEVEEARGRAEQAIQKPLPEGHPLWETQARSAALDVIALAATVGDPEPHDSWVEAELEFLAASIAVWREVDRLTDEDEDGTYPGLPQSSELRIRERAAWERYRDLLDEPNERST